MRCLGCQRVSIPIICESCHRTLFSPTVRTRKIGTLDVISFFGYKSIEPFILSKHGPVGHRLYRYFGRRHFAPFLKAFAEGMDGEARLIGIDENVCSGYSHTALLSRFGRQPRLRPLHGRLKARNRVDYAGKSLQFRLNNPRDFYYDGPSGIRAILIDDIVTTGSTLSEAHGVLLSHGVEVLFALTLADARD